MPGPTDDELAKLGAAFDAFARRYKLADALGSETMLNELDKQALLAAAVANAVFNATGKRVRDLPITLDKLL